jgi:hypothetical protein
VVFIDCKRIAAALPMEVRGIERMRREIAALGF